MSYEAATLIIAGTFAVVCAFIGYKQRVSSRLALPPSPGGSYPLLGHALVLPTDEEYLTYTKWSKELKSDIISFQALGQNIIVLSSLQSAIDLLERRSAIYSDRPQLPVISDPDLLDWSYNTGSVPYGSRWRKQRRMTHDVLKSSVSSQHSARMETETRAMLKRMLDSPHAGFEKEIRRNIAAQIMSTVYGYIVTSSDDYFVRNVQTGIGNFSRAALPGNFLVNFIPWLKYVPEWIPGTEWKRTIREWRIQRDSMIQETYDWTKGQISASTAEPSMVKTNLSNIAQDPTVDPVEEEDYLKWAASTIFGAGSDTTVSSTMSFVLAMLQHPEIQAQAQEEIDRVVGSERLPEVEDRPNMPYMQAIVREVLRWQPVLRLGFPRANTKDDVYRSYFIPKGSVVMLNVWAITRDKSVYANPDTFDPGRFLDSSVPDAPGFGLGRRMCPGNSFAEASLFIMFASLLAVFNIKPIKDSITGKELIPATRVTTNALVSHPLPFDCTFHPRSIACAKLVENC